MSQENKPHRTPTRLKGYDYTLPGGYFVTLCTHHRQNLFGRVVDGEMCLNQLGRMVEAAWLEIPEQVPAVLLDEYVVMPDHFHGIIFLTVGKSAGERRASPLQGNASGTLPTIIGSFKSAVSKRINRLRNTPGALLWQRSFYDRIIRDEKELDTFRAYIRANPLRQEIDIANGPLDE